MAVTIAKHHSGLRLSAQQHAPYQARGRHDLKESRKARDRGRGQIPAVPQRGFAEQGQLIGSGMAPGGNIPILTPPRQRGEPKLNYLTESVSG